MRLVIIESPYASDPEKNTEYAMQCMKDSLMRGEAPFVSHLLYKRVLCDKIPEERAHGIAAGLCWGRHAEATIAYIDHGISPGMRIGLNRARLENRPIEYRLLSGGIKS